MPWKRSSSHSRSDEEWSNTRSGRRSRNTSSKVFQIEVLSGRDVNQREKFLVDNEDDLERLIKDIEREFRSGGSSRTKFKLDGDPEAVEIVADVDGAMIIIVTPVGSLNPRY